MHQNHLFMNFYVRTTFFKNKSLILIRVLFHAFSRFFTFFHVPFRTILEFDKLAARDLERKLWIFSDFHAIDNWIFKPYLETKIIGSKVSQIFMIRPKPIFGASKTFFGFLLNSLLLLLFKASLSHNENDMA